MAFKNYIFDIDGTIMNSYYAGTKSIHDALLNVTGVDYSDEIIHKSYAMVQTEYLASLGIDPKSEIGKSVSKEADRIYELLSDKVTLFDGMQETIETLKKEGKFLGIVTSRVMQEFEIPMPKIFEYFEIIITADLVENPKPAPDPLNKIVKDFDLKKEETIYIGDSFQDSECAKRAGIKFAFADFISDEEVPHDYYLSNPKDILKI